MLEKILLAQMDPELVSKEIGDFVINQVTKIGYTGCVIGLSGGIDSTTTVALIKRAFDIYNENHDEELELVGYILPSKINSIDDTEDGIKVAKQLGIRYEVHEISNIVEAYRTTNPESVDNPYDRGNMTARIRANVLSTKAATEKKLVAGTGNWDEDFSLGYYTLFGDGAVHISPIGNLPKRLVRQMAIYLDFNDDVVNREPTAGLEPEQTDFKDLGYSYEVAELVIRGIKQGMLTYDVKNHPQVTETIEKEIASQNNPKFTTVDEAISDILDRHYIANVKAAIISPPVAPITLQYR